MERTMSGSGLVRGSSFFSLSLLAHVAIGAGIAFYLSHQPEAVFDDTQEYIDLGYEQFDEAPPDVPRPQPVANQEVAEVPPEPSTTKVDDAPRELQDESSTIAGTQEAKPAPPAPAAAGPSGASVPDVPYYKIKPKYPREALMNGVEGFVDLQIDVKEDGSVDNIRTVGGTQAGMFESEARRAVSKWKYKPFVDGSGSPIRKANHQVRVEFKLNDTETM